MGFLLISGFSIGKSISRNKDNYFKRRIQRIYPVYLASIILQIIVLGVVPELSSVPILVLNLLFLNQIFTGTSFVGPAWTLAVEVWLYALAPVFLKLDKKKLLYLIIFSFLCYAGYTCGRTLFNWDYYSGVSYGLNLLFLSFIWIAGFRLAVFPESKKENALIVGLIFLFHIGLVFGIQALFRIKHHEYNLIVSDLPGHIGKSICLIGVYYAVIYNHKVAAFKPLFHKIATFLGNISYPLYLSHVSVYHLLERYGIHNTALNILGALVMATLIYIIFDFYSKKRK